MKPTSGSQCDRYFGERGQGTREAWLLIIGGYAVQPVSGLASCVTHGEDLDVVVEREKDECVGRPPRPMRVALASSSAVPGLEGTGLEAGRLPDSSMTFLRNRLLAGFECSV